MKINSNSLQELINKRAEKKARDWVNKLTAQLKDSEILDIEGFYVKSELFNQSLRSSLWCLDVTKVNNPLTKLYEKKLSEFIESETKDFVSKVESLVEQTDNLLNIAENY